MKTYRSTLIINFSVLAIIPLIIFGLLVNRILTDQLKKDAGNKNLTLARSLASEVGEFLNYPENVLKEIALIIKDNYFSENKRFNAFISLLIRQHSYFTSIRLIDSNGNISHIAPYDKKVIGYSMRRQPFVEQALKTGKIFWATPFLSIETGDSIMAVSIPIDKKVIVGYINLNNLRNIVQQTNVGIKGYAFMTDRRGVVIAHPNRDAVSRRINLKYINAVKFGIEGKEGTYQYSIESTTYIGSVAKIPKTEWTAIVTQPTEEAFAVATRLQNILFASIIFAFIFAILLSLWNSMRIMKPVFSLSSNTRRIANGDYEFSASIQETYSEFNELGNDFKKMLSAVKSREQALEESKNELLETWNYLKNVFNSINSILITIDSKNKITQWNREAEIVIKLTSDEVIGKKIWDSLSFFHEYKEVLHIVNRSGKVNKFYKVSIKIYDNIHFFDITFSPLSEYKKGGVVIRMDDVTEIIKKDEQLIQSQKMETIGILAGGLAHDFNNVLSGITGTLSILDLKMEHFENLTKENITEYLEIIKKAGNRAADMVQQLLSLSRKNVTSLKAIDLNIIVQNVMKICHNTFDKSIELNPEYYSQKAMIEGNETQIEQVILNICVNASHAMTIMKPEGEHQGGELSVSINMITADENFCMSHPAIDDSMYWCIQITDTGIGMDKETVNKIFYPFFTTKDKGKGTGLGLTMVYNIIQQHNGFLTLYSETGIGTTFNLYFPVLLEYETTIETVKISEVPNGTETVLIIDDEEIIRKLAETILTNCGYTVLQAIDGEDGIEMYKKHQNEIDIIILDMVMPRKSGKEVFIELKKIKKDIKVILSSGFRQDERVNEILKLGINKFIQKPYTLDKLANAVYQVLHENDRNNYDQPHHKK